MPKRQAKPEHHLSRRPFADHPTQVIHVTQVDVLLEHDQFVEFDDSHARRHDGERTPICWIGQHLLEQGIESRVDRRNGRLVGDACLELLKFAHVIVGKTPFLGQRAGIGVLAFERLRGDETQVLGQRRAPNEQQMWVDERISQNGSRACSTEFYLVFGVTSEFSENRLTCRGETQ